MRAFSVGGSNSPYYSLVTMCCGQRVKIGDAILAQTHPTANARKTMVWHRRCVEDVLAGAPLDADVEKVNNFRAGLLASGQYVER